MYGEKHVPRDTILSIPFVGTKVVKSKIRGLNKRHFASTCPRSKGGEVTLQLDFSPPNASVI